MSQTTIREFMRPRYPGMRYGIADERVVTGMLEGDANTRAQFGTFVVQGAADRGCALASVLNDAPYLKGVIAHEHNHEKMKDLDDSATTPGLKIGATLSLTEKGRVACLLEQSVTPEDPVFVRVIATEENPIAGTVRKDADAGNAVPLYGATFVESSTGSADDGLSVPVDFDLNAYRAAQKIAASIEA